MYTYANTHRTKVWSMHVAEITCLLATYSTSITLPLPFTICNIHDIPQKPTISIIYAIVI